MEEIPRTVAGHLDDAAVGEKGGLHAILVLIGQSLARFMPKPAAPSSQDHSRRRFS
jgi:hypothetical protein